MNEPARLSGVTKAYGRKTVLNHFDLDVRPGETLALLGPNGAGKTTAIRILLGILPADDGIATLFGADPRSHVARRRVGAMLQTGGVPPTLTAREHIAVFSSYYPHPLGVDETIERAGIADFADRRFGKLSGGQQQRALFALAICGDPDLLVLDEPTNALDVEARRILWRMIRTFAASGRSVLLATHDLVEAERLASRIAIVRDGRVATVDTVEKLITHARSASFEDAVLALAGIDSQFVEAS